MCVLGYTSGNDSLGNPIRHVTQATKNQVFKEYGLSGKEDKFEIDHEISLELGGNNDIKNLWPQSYNTMPWNAHVKDKIEDRLHSLVCKGTITLQEAQMLISGDWRIGYCRYFDDLASECQAIVKTSK